jgi:oligopeptide/dipeptide ABC transporter ATP-binding protein
MYLGRIVEIGSTAEMFTDPRHPYTRSLLAAVPEIGGRRVTDEALLRGEPPSPGRLPSGCRFRTRCPLAQAICAETEPPLIALPSGRRAACHFVA